MIRGFYYISLFGFRLFHLRLKKGKISRETFDHDWFELETGREKIKIPPKPSATNLGRKRLFDIPLDPWHVSLRETNPFYTFISPLPL